MTLQVLDWTIKWSVAIALIIGFSCGVILVGREYVTLAWETAKENVPTCEERGIPPNYEFGSDGYRDYRYCRNDRQDDIKHLTYYFIARPGELWDSMLAISMGYH